MVELKSTLSQIYRSTRQNINTEITEMNQTCEQMDLLDVQRVTLCNIKIHILLPSMD